MTRRHVHHAATATPSMGAPDHREKRAAPRVGWSIDVELDLEGRVFASVLRDLSATGAAVIVEGDVELGQVMQVRFSLPSEPEEVISCAGLIRSVRLGQDKHLCGIEFHHLDSQRRKSIANWVREEVAPAPGNIARNHWRGEVHSSEAFFVPSEEKEQRALRWQLGIAAIFKQVAQHLIEQDRVFVPYIGTDLSEGERVYLEVVPPTSHFVFRVLAEVVWVQRTANGHWDKGVGLRLAGLTPMDRHTLKAQLRWFRQESERYR